MAKLGLVFYLILLPSLNQSGRFCPGRMLPADLAKMTLSDYCALYSSGNLPEEFNHLSLSDIVRLSDEDSESLVVPRGDITEVVATAEMEESNTIEKKFEWREPLPNSNNTNVPLVLVRGDENNEATVGLCLGLYESEFKDLDNNETLEVEVKGSDGNLRSDKFQVDIDYPKDEKLARKTSGLAGSGSDYLCTYCSSRRTTCMDTPPAGDSKVTLTNTLLRETAQYCLKNPSKKSQEQIASVARGVKVKPVCCTEPCSERPDALHLGNTSNIHCSTFLL